MLEALGGVLVAGASLRLAGLVFAAHRGRRRASGERAEARAELAWRIEAERRRSADRPAWAGLRPFIVRRKVQEARGVFSFCLSPVDGAPLPPYSPGQYLTFSLHFPGKDKPTVRCYSLSDAPRTDQYRITIKQVLPPRDLPDGAVGLVSSYFAERVKEGDVLSIKAPGGHFTLFPQETTPVVLIGAGIGLTPVLSMLNSIVESKVPRETWFCYGVRNRTEHAMKEHLEKVAARARHVHLHVCYSDPAETDARGRDYHHRERVSVDLLRRILPSNRFVFYLCGPPPMMEALVKGLLEWGVPKENVRFEAFGPASVKRLGERPKSGEETGIEVRFRKSGKKAIWTGEEASLLEIADACGVVIDRGCCAGNCESCLTGVVSGEVLEITEPGVTVSPGRCLPCISLPAGPLVLDA